MYSNQREDNIFSFPETQSNIYELPAQPKQRSRSPQPSPLYSTDWRLEVMANAPKLCGGALIFFMVLFGGSLLIANSSDDLRAIRGKALENSSTALLGLSAMGAGAWWLKSKH